jgi:hypothetical protein
VCAAAGSPALCTTLSGGLGFSGGLLRRWDSRLASKNVEGWARRRGWWSKGCGVSVGKEHGEVTLREDENSNQK